MVATKFKGTLAQWNKLESPFSWIEAPGKWLCCCPSPLPVGGSGQGISEAPDVTSNPAEISPCGRALVWLQGIPGNVSTQPVSSEDMCLLFFFNRKSNYKPNPQGNCQRLSLHKLFPWDSSLSSIHPARNGERAGTEQLQLGKGQPQAGAELWL